MLNQKADQKVLKIKRKMNKLNVNRLFGRRYKLGLINTKVLDNFQCFRKYTYNLYERLSNEKNEEIKKELFNELHSIHQSRIKQFKELFGNQDFIFRNEHNMYAWVVEHNGCEAIIFSGKGKGTLVEIILNKESRPKGSVDDFLGNYLELVKTLN